MEMRVAILKFDDRNRYGESGIPTTVLFGGTFAYELATEAVPLADGRRP
jgi:hypothetical protein